MSPAEASAGAEQERPHQEEADALRAQLAARGLELIPAAELAHLRAELERAHSHVATLFHQLVAEQKAAEAARRATAEEFAALRQERRQAQDVARVLMEAWEADREASPWGTLATLAGRGVDR